MATAKKLPSGQYRCRAYVGKDADGKKIIKSFTAKSKAMAEHMASDYVLNHKAKPAAGSMTFGTALDKYIAGRESVLSPSTIREYKRMRDNKLAELKDLNLDDLNQDRIQDFINALCKDGLASKYVRNIHGLISAVLNQSKPSMKLTTTLPAKTKPNLYIPSDDEVKSLIEYIRPRDHDLLVSILLAAYGPMRRSEVCALEYEDITGNVVHVHRAMVDAGKNWITKNKPKTEAGDRFINFPEFVINEIGTGSGRVVNCTPDYITDNFAKILKQANIHHFRYHDLRHYSASIQHALGIPDAYIMQRGGWESDTTLKNIYRHALDQESAKANEKINDYFTKLQSSGHES